MDIFVIAMGYYLNGQYMGASLAHEVFGKFHRFNSLEICETKLDELFEKGVPFDPEKNMKYHFFTTKHNRRILTVIGSPHGGTAIEKYNYNCTDVVD